MTRLQTIEIADQAYKQAKLLPEGSDERAAAIEAAWSIYNNVQPLVLEASPRAAVWN